MPARFDAIVIGAGQSGPSLADRLVKDGQAVAVIERQHFEGRASIPAACRLKPL